MAKFSFQSIVTFLFFHILLSHQTLSFANSCLYYDVALEVDSSSFATNHNPVKFTVNNIGITKLYLSVLDGNTKWPELFKKSATDCVLIEPDIFEIVPPYEYILTPPGADFLIGAIPYKIIYTLTNGEYLLYTHDNFEAGPSFAIYAGNTGNVNPTNSVHIFPDNAKISSDENNGSIIIVSPPNCPWTPSSNDDWVLITGGFAGSGIGRVSYRILPNNLSQTRVGTISIWSTVFHIEQGPKPTYLPFIPLLMNDGNSN